MTERAPELDALASALRGQYEVEREIGRGGMGVVFLARDLKLDRLAAIKCLPSHLAQDPRVRERFLREARTAAALSHPNIVPIHRADEIDGHVFFVMGFVDGESLAHRVRQQGRLGAREVMLSLRDVANALHYAHQRGVVHRDVKAENILIDRSTGRALVTDFGIARVGEATNLTASGLILGSVYYMSPEQVMGERMDGRSDVYSLGVTAFYALTGRFPFENEMASAVLVGHVNTPAPPVRSLVPNVPESAAALVDRCLAKNPASRFESADELMKATDNVLVALRYDPAAAPRTLMSETAAREVWERAAELASHPDAPPVGRRTSSSAMEEPVTSGYDVSHVREAAREAGIGTEHIDRALVERGLAGSEVVPADSPAVTVDRKTNPWAGAPIVIEFEAIVEGEVPEHDLDVLAEVIRRELNDVGNVSALGRSLTWGSTQKDRQVRVSVFVRGGRTTIRVSERMSQLAGGIFGGLLGGAGGGFSIPTIAIVSNLTVSPFLGVAAAVGLVAGTYGVARMIFQRVVGNRERVLKRLTNDLVETAQDIVRGGQLRLTSGQRRLLP
jgi:eukaryotic-like serine/threonine-protein kinase